MTTSNENEQFHLFNQLREKRESVKLNKIIKPLQSDNENLSDDDEIERGNCPSPTKIRQSVLKRQDCYKNIPDNESETVIERRVRDFDDNSSLNSEMTTMLFRQTKLTSNTQLTEMRKEDDNESVYIMKNNNKSKN